MAVLIEDGKVNGAGPIIFTSIGAKYVVTVSGVFDGATLDIQTKSPEDPNGEGAWITNKLYTVKDMDEISFLPLYFQARAFISNAGDLTNLFAGIRL